MIKTFLETSCLQQIGLSATNDNEPIQLVQLATHTSPQHAARHSFVNFPQDAMYNVCSLAYFRVVNIILFFDKLLHQTVKTIVNTWHLFLFSLPDICLNVAWLTK